MAFSFGRQFRRIAAEALTADPDEMRALIARILPARDDGAPRVLRLTSESDYRRAPAVIVAAFFADAITGEEAAELLARTMDPATRKQVQQERHEAEDRAWRWSDARPTLEEYRAEHPELVARWEREAAERRNAAKMAGALVNNKENTSAPADGSAADGIREHPPPMIGLQIGAESHAGGYGAEVG